IRRYPDITHSLRCEHPVPDWDAAFAATHGREPINPRPLGMRKVFREDTRRWADGFLTYSEGCNDDVNKAVWSALGWDPAVNVRAVLRDYGAYFSGPEHAHGFARLLLGLEDNWTGPALTNTGIEATLRQAQAMEKAASPQVKLNWRFQQVLYRAYYDAF